MDEHHKNLLAGVLLAVLSDPWWSAADERTDLSEAPQERRHPVCLDTQDLLTSTGVLLFSPCCCWTPCCCSGRTR